MAVVCEMLTNELLTEINRNRESLLNKSDDLRLSLPSSKGKKTLFENKEEFFSAVEIKDPKNTLA